MVNLNKTNIYNNMNIFNYLEVNGTTYFNGINIGLNDYYHFGYDKAENYWNLNSSYETPIPNSDDDKSWAVGHSLKNWNNGLISKKQFLNNKYLTLEFEIKIYYNGADAPQVAIGFIEGNSFNFNHNQTPSRMFYFTYTTSYIYENGTNRTEILAAKCYQDWRKYKVTTNGEYCKFYHFYEGVWSLMFTSTTSLTEKQLKILISHYCGIIYLKNIIVYDDHSI